MTPRHYIPTALLISACIVLLILPAPLEAQEAARLAAILGKSTISYDEAAVFVLEAAEQAVFDDPDDAFRFAKERNWLPKKAEPGAAARLNGVSFLLMNAFELKGGMFYRLAPNPHHAYRELVYQDVIQGDTDPAMTVSGEEFLFMIGQILTMKETTIVETTEEQIIIEESSTDEDTVIQKIPAVSFPNIMFLPNSAVLQDSEKIKLQEIVEVLKMIPGKKILVAGHTALADTETSQLRSSLERARAVASYLASLGIETNHEIIIRGFGAQKPIADNNTEEGMAENRRVEITILETAKGNEE